MYSSVQVRKTYTLLFTSDRIKSKIQNGDLCQKFRDILELSKEF